MTRKNTAGEKDSVIAVVILLLMAFIFLKSRYWVYAALALSVISVLSPQATHYVHRIWSLFTEILGRISGGIILTLVFIFILIPTALLKRWFGKKEVILNKGNRLSTFQTRNHKYIEGDLENPW
jgi:hypothetical protein